MNKATKSDLSVSYGTIERLENFTSKYISSRNIDVWLPPNYSSQKKYAVIYMHDGQMLFDSTNTWNHLEWGVDENIEKIHSEQNIKDALIVGIWNAGKARHAEYFPQKPFESLAQVFQDSLLHHVSRSESNSLFSKDVYSDAYLKFIVEELKPYIDKSYSTLSDRENTSLMGSSMGGLISMYALCEYPNIFGSAACLSTHWVGTFNVDNNPIPDAFISYLDKNIPKAARFYFDYGTETLDALYEPFQVKIDSVMAKNGYNSDLWITKKFVGHQHSEDDWNRRLEFPLRFLLNKN